jgi:hypothetical protein
MDRTGEAFAMGDWKSLTLLEETTGGWDQDGRDDAVERARVLLDTRMRDIRAVSGDGQLARISDESGRWRLEILDGFQEVRRTEAGEWQCDVTVRALPDALADVASVTDAVWSGTSKRLYVLDTTQACIHVVYASAADVSAAKAWAIPLDTRGLSLSEECRLQVVPRKADRPDLVDPILHMSVPASQSILSIDLTSSSFEPAFAGGASPQGRPLTGARREIGGYPTSLAYDAPSASLVIGDSASGHVLSLGPDGAVARLCDYYYRPCRIVGVTVLRPRATLLDRWSPSARSEATPHGLVVLADSAQGRVRAIRAQASDQEDFVSVVESFMGSLTGLLVLPGGHLLLTRENETANAVYDVGKLPSKFFVEHLAS